MMRVDLVKNVSVEFKDGGGWVSEPGDIYSMSHDKVVTLLMNTDQIHAVAFMNENVAMIEFDLIAR